MVIALIGVQFGPQHEFDLKSQVRFHTKSARPEVQLPFIRSILKSHKLIAQIQELQDFSQYQYLLNQVAKVTKQGIFFVFHFTAV